MNEREELELAAKAVGIRLEWDGDPTEWAPFNYDGKTYDYWNPRLDKADAMDLAEALGMEIYFSHKFVLLSGKFKWGENEECKTVCEAITRAAALYQKAMEGK